MNQQMVRGAAEGAAVGGSIGGVVAWSIGALMLGLQPVVFLACGVYAGVVYGGIVGALMGARERETAPAPQRRPAFGLALARVYSQRR